MEERNAWIDIITKLYTKLHMSKRVMHTATENDKKRARVINYLERIDKVHKKVAETHSKSAETLLKKYYYALYVIKPEDIPESYFQNELRIARERGYGDIELTDERKQTLINQIIEDQKDSLDKWIEYFLYDEESKSYEPWEKYWVFQGLQKLGKFDKETGKFSKRDKTTVYPFPPVEREAIFTALKLMEEYIKDKKGEDEIKDALGQGNFKTLYEYSIRQIMNKGEKKTISTEGIWIKYDQGSDYNILRDSLQGYYTGWCTAAGENFAKTQLESGDFYVYYSKDENGEPKIPRIAIRMEGHNTIGEIRGIANDQNMEDEMLPILDKKLEEFPDRDKYRKKEYDMQFLTTIDKKAKKGIELTIEELRFLYEIDGKIEGFGYREDPRIEEIISERDIKKDLSKVLNCSLDEIGLTEDDLGKPLKYYRDNLYLNRITTPKEIPFPLPEHIGGGLYLDCLTSAKGLVLPKQIGGYLDLSFLTSTEGLTLPEQIGCDLDLRCLASVKNLTLPKHVGGNLYLNHLKSAEGLTLPKSLGGLYLENLTSAKGLILPKQISYDLDLRNLTSVEGLILPERVGENLYLNHLTSAEGLTLPEYIGGDLYLNHLKSAEGLALPKSLGGLYLENLTSAEGLVLPKQIGYDLDLRNLTSAEGLTLPKRVGGDLYLNHLTSIEGLTLPKNIGDSLYLNSLTSAEGLILPEHIPGYLNLKSLDSIEGLKLPSDFDLNTLVLCNYRTEEEREIIVETWKEEIKAHPEKYFRTKEEEEELFHSDKTHESKDPEPNQTVENHRRR